MKVKDHLVMSDGFDKNVAEKMPKIRKEEVLPPPEREEPISPMKKEIQETSSSTRPLEREQGTSAFLPPIRDMIEDDQNFDVSRLIEDLHGQLLVSNQTKRALEMDLVSSRKILHQFEEANKALGRELEDLRMELKRLREIQTETTYLKEENTDALERIKELQQELRAANDVLTKMTQDRDEALNRTRDLESQMEKTEILRMRGKLKEREASHFADENRELRTRLEEAITQNIDLERKYETIKKSFHDVKESLTLLRDSCKKNYYNLSETPDQE